MAYSTITDVEHAAGGNDRLLQLTDWGEDSAVGEAAVEKAIAEADAWIDSIVGKRVETPLGEVHPLIQMISSSEAVFRLRSYRSMISDADMLLHKEREETLKDIAAGRITLGDVPKSRHIVDRQTATNDVAISRARMRGFW
jgi:phage gp36-like protein